MEEIPEDVMMRAQRHFDSQSSMASKRGDRISPATVIALAILAERERAAAVAYRVCAETRHVALGDAAATAIRSGASP